MAERISGAGILYGVLALALVTVNVSIPGLATVPSENSSRVAIEAADELARSADRLRYDDPRVAPTDGFVRPDRSLVPETPGLVALWKITEHRPARYMKTIDIRVRWSRPGPDGEVVLSTVKAS